MNTLNDQVALVTGAGHSKGIGWATAMALADAGAHVVVTDIASNEDGLTELADTISKTGRKSMARVLDVSELGNARSVVADVVAEFGKLDILVNNAGIAIGSSAFLENGDDVWKATLGVNVYGVLNCCRAVLPQMQDQGSGAIVNVSSLAGLRHIPTTPTPYTTSKFAVVGITKSIAEEFAPSGIRCNAVCPGSVATQMQDKAMELMGAEDEASRAAAEAEENALIAMGRPAQPAEIASAVVFLASSSASYINGAALPVDGGWFVGL
jgi:3-oxoacyl-[acyl-carrier protein] reductase